MLYTFCLENILHLGATNLICAYYYDYYNYYLRQGFTIQFRLAFNPLCTQAGPKLTVIFLPQPSNCWDYRHVSSLLPCAHYFFLEKADTMKVL